MEAGNLRASLRLMAVTGPGTPPGEIVAAAVAAVRGGATSVQLRRKDLTPAELCRMARALCAAVAVPVLVNDDVAVALAAGAHGVHLGADDLPAARVRRLVPPGFVIGVSVGSAAEVENGQAGDYWGIGPWRATGTKADAGPALEPAALADLAAAAGGRPWVAIGGVLPDDVPAALSAGAAGVAVVSGIFGRPDPAVAARAYRPDLR